MSEPTWELLGGGGVVGGPIDYVGAWAAGTTYQPGQVVRYAGVDYLAVNPSLGQVPPSAAPFGSGIGTSLPASPFDGQEYVLTDSLTAPTYSWRFRYTASITDAYKWVFVGGSEYSTTASIGAYTALVAGPSAQTPVFVTPRAGIWDCEVGCQFTGVTVGSTVALSAGTTAPGSPAPTGSLDVANHHFSIVAANRLSGVGSGVQISLWTNPSHANLSAANRWLSVLPVRVA